MDRVVVEGNLSHKGFLFGVDGKILTRIEGFYLFAKRYIIKGDMLKTGRLKFSDDLCHARSHPKPSPNAAPFALQQHQRPTGGGGIHTFQPDAVCGEFGGDFRMEKLLLLSCADDDNFGQTV